MCTYFFSCASACNTDTTQTQPHQISNTQQTENTTTDVVIQQQSRKLLMMDILMSETCWAHKKWNKIASDIKLVLYSSTVYVFVGAPHRGTSIITSRRLTNKKAKARYFSYLQWRIKPYRGISVTRYFPANPVALVLHYQWSLHFTGVNLPVLTEEQTGKINT